MKVGNKVLGLAVGQKSILVAEVATKGGRYSVTRVGEFTFPEGVPMSNPEKLGESLGEFLKTNRFSARGAVIGLPAKRLLTRRKEVPPASPDVVASTLRLQTESEFSSDLDNLIIDFAGQPSTAEATTVLVVATQRVAVDELTTMAKTAGLKVHGVTSTTAALGRATSRLPGGDGLVLSLGVNGAELVIQHGQDPAHIKHLNILPGSEGMPALAGDIRRTMASIPRNGTPQTLALWNATSTQNPGSVLEQRLSMPVTTPELGSLVATDSPDAEAYVPAVAVALAALEPAGLPVDFLNSRLAAPKPPVIGLPKLLAIVAGVLIAAFTAYAFIDLGDRQKKIDDIVKKNKELEPKVKDAQKIIARTDVVNNWLRNTPRFVGVLRDLTSYFPAGANTVWATDLLNRNDSLSWQVVVVSPTDSMIFTLADSMAAGQRFADVKITSVVQERATRDQPALYKAVIAFTYKDPNAPATQPAAATAPAGRGAARPSPATTAR